MSDVSLETIVSLCKRRGFIYQGSEVYGGLAGTWDYGPLGVALKHNIMNLWWQTFVDSRDDMYGVDAAILMNQKVWQASGHAETFTDPAVFCLNCNNRFRVDKIIDEKKYKKYIEHTLQDFLSEQLSNYKDSEKVVKELEETNSPLFKEIEAGLKELEKLRKANISTEVYRKWLETLIPKIEKGIEKKEEISEKYDHLLLFLQIHRDLRDKVMETKQYLGEFAQYFLNHNSKCPVCGIGDKWSVPRQFNMMFKTNVGPVEDENSISYLRPETAQGIFTNYKNVVDSFYPDLPFGIAQVGKAFRNEISPRDFVFRAREFEQMEIEYFVNEKDWKPAFEQWVKDIEKFLKDIGLPDGKVHKTEVPEEDRAHYSQRTIDFEFDYPHAQDELLGLAYRTNFDLMNIQRATGRSMEYQPKDKSKPFVPHVIEPSFGVERAVMAVLVSAYAEDEIGGEKRAYLKLPADLAPVKVAVFPLLKNKPELTKKAREVYETLKKSFDNVMYDDNGNIGKRYRRQDEIGTPYCVTIDFDTLEDDTVTVRNRDTTKQERVKTADMITKL